MERGEESVTSGRAGPQQGEAELEEGLRSALVSAGSGMRRTQHEGAAGRQGWVCGP